MSYKKLKVQINLTETEINSHGILTTSLQNFDKSRDCLNSLFGWEHNWIIELCVDNVNLKINTHYKEKRQGNHPGAVKLVSNYYYAEKSIKKL